MKHTAYLVIAFIVLSGIALGQEKRTANTLGLAAGAAGERATIADIEWLAGSWTGTGLGGVSEETWSRPAGGVMVGFYRLLRDDKPVFYESMWMIEAEGTIILRLKHFHPDLVGWEEKDKTVDFRFVKREGDRVYFSGLTFERVGSDGLKIYLALRRSDGKLNEEFFSMKRTK